MAVGVVFQIANLTQKQYRVPSGYEAPSVAILNPNDGSVYVARNREANGSSYAQWDWKIPSQSYALLPGPFITAGIYYLDQSGTGRAGEVSVYDVPQRFLLPTFHAIGRAALSATTSMDVNIGAQPGNPPANTARIWIDVSGHEHILQSSGTDFIVLDSNNYASYVTPLIGATALGTDLYGTVADAHIGVRYGNAIQMYDSVGTRRNLISMSGAQETRINALGTGLISFVNQANSAYLMYVDTAGTLTVTGGIVASASISAGPIISSGAGDLNANRNNGTGYLFLGNGSHYFGFDGSLYQMPTSGLAIGGNLYMAGSYAYFLNQTAWIYFDGSFFRPTHSTAFSATGNQISWPNASYISGVAGYVQGSSLALKHASVSISDNDLLARVADPRLPVTSYLWPDDPRRYLGFLADDIALVLPESVIRDDNGAPAGYNPQELTAILWGAVRALNGRIDQLVTP